MCEKDFRKTLTPEELKERGFIILPVKLHDVAIVEKLCYCSDKFEKTFDQLIHIALERLFKDIEDIEIIRRK